MSTDDREPAIAWFHCFAGIAGDMALGALIAAGADVDEVTALVRRVPISGWRLQVSDTMRSGVACCRALVTHQDDAVVRTHAHIQRLLAEAALPERVHRRASAVFAALAGAEAELHGRRPDQIHFHEVGGHDAVVDIVGTCAALEVLGVERVTCSPVSTGTGMVRSAHGLLPNPSPAVVRLLRGLPTYGRQISVELTTPTGAALVAALAEEVGPMPPMTIAGDGFGAGTAEIDGLPNCTQVVLGWAPEGGRAPDPGAGQPVVVLEANLDDATGEQLALAIADLIAAGALDAWITPVTMKKGRPGHVVHALADPPKVPALRRVFHRDTGTFGVRATFAERWPASRQLDQVDVAGATVRIKAGPDRVKAEFDDVAAASLATGLPPGQVASLAEEAWRRRGGAESMEPPRAGHGTSDGGDHAR